MRQTNGNQPPLTDGIPKSRHNKHDHTNVYKNKNKNSLEAQHNILGCQMLKRFGKRI
jgi:hypothetical protein